MVVGAHYVPLGHALHDATYYGDPVGSRGSGSYCFAIMLGHDSAVYLRTLVHLFPNDLPIVAGVLDRPRTSELATRDESGPIDSAKSKPDVR